MAPAPEVRSRLRLSRRRVALLVCLAAWSLAAAWLAARVGGPGEPWLWNLDMPKIDFPLAVFFHDALSQGSLPLWNDSLGLGFPLYAEGQIGAFYPPNWLLFQLPPLSALDMTRLLHLALAGTGAGLLALRVTGSRAGAFVAAAGAVLCGGIVAKLQWTNVVAAYAWLPWILLPLVRRPSPSARGLAVAGILWGVQALTGHPNTWLLTGIAAGVVMVAANPRWMTLARLAGFAALGVAVGAVQLVPTLLLTTLSVRSRGLDRTDLFASSATPFDPLGFAFSDAFVTRSSGAWDLSTTWFPDGAFALLEVTAYVGLPILVLAAIASGTRRVRPLLVAAVVLAAIPVVSAFQPAWWENVPILASLRSPVRAYLIVDVLLVVAAALGLTRAMLRRRGSGQIAWLVIAVAAGAYVAAGAAAVVIPDAFEAVLQAFTSYGGPEQAAADRSRAVTALASPWPLAGEVALGGLCALLVWAAPRAMGPRLPAGPRQGRLRMVQAILVLAAVLPLALLSPGINPVRPYPAFSSEETAFVRTLQAQDARRVLTIKEPGWYSGMPDQLAAAGVPDIRMFSSLNLLASDRLLDQLRVEGPETEKLRRAVGIDVVVTFDAPCPGEFAAAIPEERATVCRLRGAIRPPYWMTEEAVRDVGGEATWPAIRPVEATVDVASAVASARPVEVARWDAGGGSFTVDAPEDGWVFVDRAWWPAWQTSIDGRAVPVFLGMGGQLIRVPAGRHLVEQSLVLWDAAVGLVAGLIAVSVATGVACLRYLRRARRRPEVPTGAG